MKRNKSLRLVIFGIGLVAVVLLTGMNVYSLYELRESTIETAKDDKRNQIEDFTNQVRHRFFRPFRGIRKLDIEYIQEYYYEYGHFPQSFRDVLMEASRDSIFQEIYYSPDGINHCTDSSQPIYQFNQQTGHFQEIEEVHQRVCDGMGLARSRMQVLIEDYRWNNKATFDTHRSMTLSMIDLRQRSVIGHLTFTIDRDYLLNDYLTRNLAEKFGPADETGISVWLVDFMQEEILALSDPDVTYERGQQVDIRQRFFEMFDNWTLHASVIDSPTIAATNASLRRNMIVLVTTVLALISALIFMYITAKRERELAQRQSGFLANVTHELKTPLAAMQAAGENLSDGRVEDRKRIRTYGEHIYTETIRLRKMIEKLLDIARLDSGQAMVQRTRQESEPLLRKFYNSYYDHAISRGFTFDLQIQPDLPAIEVDPEHMETILGNLVDNAMKYSGDQKTVHVEGSRSADGGVSFKVKDHGIGIPKKAQKRIFEKFYRVEDVLTAETKGHGLGLSIVENLVKLNGGTITLESVPGKGTTFTVTFPKTEETSDEGLHETEAIKPEPANMKPTGYAT